ncbi:MAG: hypothetical protein UU81_C0047G0006 [Microgenomates group bacterium GW2011_GWC1_41_8]|nr:MAG: hypothetical protein UU81_C0047G0006 [Microgenomates group bacterium GW2011_GWC1_41_8]
MANRTVIYTVIFGNYDELQEPAVLPPGCDFICLADKPQKSKHWQIRIMEMPVPGDLTRSNRRIKMLAHEYFPEYEYSVYIDGNVLIKGDVNELIRDYLSDANMALYRHDSRDCIYAEAEAIIKLCKEKGYCQDDPAIIRKQMERYRKENYPLHNGLGTTMVLLRRHNEPDVRRAMEAWWDIERSESKRDQLSFNYIAWKQNFSFKYFAGYSRNNDYFYRHKGHHKPPEKFLRRFFRALFRPESYSQRLRKRFAPIRMLSTYGFRYSCPFCGWHARRFYTLGLSHPVFAEKEIIGAGERANSKCPKCGSKERERLIYLYLNEKGWFNAEGRRILHVAPEPSLRRVLHTHYQNSYVATTYDPQKKKLVYADIQALPFESQSFDLIICNHILEHVENDKLAMRELYRVLKAGGLAILQVPFSSALAKTQEDSSIVTPDQRTQIFGQDDHVRLYGTDYIDRLMGAGFKAKALLPKQFLSEGEIKKAALNPVEPLFLATREEDSHNS